LDETDLDHIGIKVPGHRKTLLLLSKRTNAEEEMISLAKQSQISISHADLALSPHSNTPQAASGAAAAAKKNPIMLQQPRKLEGLNYWTRAKARTTPWVRICRSLENASETHANWFRMIIYQYMIQIQMPNCEFFSFDTDRVKPTLVRALTLLNSIPHSMRN
jgi:hypothetical protein